jgi:NADP oxidoreductase coenzyme F420-dependent
VAGAVGPRASVRLAVWGTGAVGARAARQLASTDGVERIVVAGHSPERREAICESLGPVAVAVEPEVEALVSAGCDAVVLAMAGDHAVPSRRMLAANVHVVSTSSAVADAESLLDLDAEARERERAVIAGAAFSPGLSCLLAGHLGRLFDRVDEIHVAVIGAGGPACAEGQRRALTGTAVEWRDRTWVERTAGTSAELVWFPDPIGGHECVRTASAVPVLLVRAFPEVERVTARQGAGLADRLVARIPFVRRQLAEGALGVIRVEVRGEQAGGRAVQVYGAIDRPALATGSVAAIAAVAAVEGRLARVGAGGIAEMANSLEVLSDLARRGVKAAVFEGVP